MKYDDGGFASAEPVQNPMMVWIVTEVSEKNVVGVGGRIGRNRLDLRRPVVGLLPTGWFQNPKPHQFRQLRQQLDGIVRNTRSRGGQRRRPQQTEIDPFLFHA